MDVLQSELKNVRFVVFDFDDTLVDEEYWILSRWSKTLTKFSFLYPSGSLLDSFLAIYKEKGRKYKFHVDDTLRLLEIDRQWISPIVENFLKEQGEEKLLPGAVEILRLLKYENFSTGIITNGLKITHEYRINHSRLNNYIDFVTYGDYVKKPNNLIFKNFMDMAGINTPSEILYIGNDYDEDIRCAQSLNINSLWLRDGTYDQDTIPNNSIQSLHEIKEYIVSRKITL